MSGITSGGSCRSPSIVTTASPAGRFDPSGERDLVAEVAREADEADVRVDGRDRDEPGPRPVGGAVVDDHDLVWAQGLDRRSHARVQLRHERLLVEDRDDDGKQRLRYSGHGIPDPVGGRKRYRVASPH